MSRRTSIDNPQPSNRALQREINRLTKHNKDLQALVDKYEMEKAHFKLLETEKEKEYQKLEKAKISRVCYFIFVIILMIYFQTQLKAVEKQYGSLLFKSFKIVFL